MKTDMYLIGINRITSFKGILKELKILDTNLQSAHLPQFQLFNSAYLVVTNHIYEAANNNYFNNPKFIEKFTVTFASYYFKAVNDTLKASDDLNISWVKLNQLDLSSAPVFVSLLMGANAHINNDLPRVLLRLMETEDTEDLFSDLRRIDKLLMKSGKEIIELFVEPNKTLNVLKRRFKFVYYRPTMYMLLFWRVIAWRNYRKIKKNNATLTRINERSIKIANRLLRLANVLV